MPKITVLVSHLFAFDQSIGFCPLHYVRLSDISGSFLALIIPDDIRNIVIPVILFR